MKMKNNLGRSVEQFDVEDSYNGVQPHQVAGIPEMRINKGLVIGGAFGILVAVFLLINLFMSPAFTFSVGATEPDNSSNAAVEVDATGSGGGGGTGGGGGGGGKAVTNDSLEKQKNASQNTTTQTWHKCTICNSDVTGIEDEHFLQAHNGRGSYTIEERTIVK